MTARSTLRWGDQQPVIYKTPATPPTGPVALGSTKQLTQAHWRWPLSWTVLLIMVPQLPAAEAGTFTVTWSMTIGEGQSTINFPWSYTFVSVGGVYVPQTVQHFLPAQDIQVIASLSGAPTLASASESFLLGSFAAPFTEPHAMTHLLERLTGEGGQDEPAERWIPTGFGDQPLRYQR